MVTSSVGPHAGAGVTATARPIQLGSTVAETSGAMRAVAAFALVVCLGGVVLWRADSFLDRSIDASMEQPVSSLGYGLAAHAVIAFVGVYLANKLARYGVFGSASSYVGLGVGVALVGVAGAVGFTVVGSTVTDLLAERRGWPGLVLGGVVAAGIAVVAPDVGAVLWFGIVSVGVGGPVREWVQASVVADLEAERSS